MSPPAKSPKVLPLVGLLLLVGAVAFLFLRSPAPRAEQKAPARVPYSGTVSPSPDGRWKVKVKLKRCETNGNFQDVSGEQKIVGQPGGKFSGEIPVPENGAYSIRARFQSDNRPQSDKLYLKVGS